MKTNSKFRRFLSNDITLLVTSLLMAFAIWFVINANSQTEGNKTITNIPITIELPQDAIDDELEVFTTAELTASVEVSGNRMTVGSLSADDIKIEAFQSNMIIAPGSYTLELSAKKNSVKSNYNFASNVSPSTINIFVDKRKDKEFAITDELVYKVEEGYYANSSLSSTTVTVSGPETEVSAIEKVAIRGTLEGTVNNTKSDDFDLIFLDKDGNELDLKMSTLSETAVRVSLTPLPILEVDLKVDVTNAPSSYPKIKINPSKIKIAAEQDVLDSIKDNKVYIGTLNFASLSNKKNSLDFDITLPNGCKNLSDSKVAKVSIDLSDYEKKTLTVNNFKTENIDLSKYSVAFNSSGVDVQVCGPADLLGDIKPIDVITSIDFTDKLNEDFKNSASFELPLIFDFTNRFDDCWIYGDYTVTVNVTKK